MAAASGVRGEASGVEVPGVRGEGEGVSVAVGEKVDVTVAETVRVALGLGVTVFVAVGVGVSVGVMLADGEAVTVGRLVHVGVGVGVGARKGKRAGNPPFNWTFPKKIKEKSRIRVAMMKNGQRLRLAGALGAAGVTLRVMVRVLPPRTAAGMGGRGRMRSRVEAGLARACSRASMSAAPVG